MEQRRGQERDIGLPNSFSYNPPQTSQESPVKLPLAPIVSTPPERRGNATVSARRGSSIFSPTQTLDHQHQHQLNPPPAPPPPPLPLVQKEPGPDPDPAPSATPTSGGATNLKNTPPPPKPAAATNSGAIRYRECLKNHAASMGGHVVDGCGEFMPSGEDNTPEALRCAACDCHRNFHRKEVEGEAPQQSHYYSYNPNSSGTNNNAHRTPLLHQHHRNTQCRSYTHGPAPPKMVNFGGGGAAESSSEDLNMFQSSGAGHAVMQPSFSGSKKRFRSKFSQEQKDRMHDFAVKLGWRMQKQDEQEVQRFCDEVGVKRQVFKVWMHNNKQAMKKRQT